MTPQFPLYIDLYNNNCTIFGGGNAAAVRAFTLLKFGAKVTVISPTLCSELQELDKKHLIRYIPRRYYRGDCTSCYLCVAATNDEAVNIAISDECKAKAISVNVSRPAAFGTFLFPTVISEKGVTISVVSDKEKKTNIIKDYIADLLPDILKSIDQEEHSVKD